MLSLSVVIPTLNRPADLERTLDSIGTQSRLPTEVIVVDQSQDLTTREVCASFSKKWTGKPVRLRYEHREERSLVKARNFGATVSVGDLLCFLDDDIRLLDGYFEKIVRFFDEHPDTAGVGGNVLDKEPSSSLRWAVRKIIWRTFLFCDFKGGITLSGFGFPICERAIDRPMRVQCLSGCNMTFRSEWFRKELFDEWFSGYSFREDVDLSYRMSRHGTLWMIPDARLYHYQSPVNRLRLRSLKAMEMKNYAYFYRKNVRRHAWQDLLFLYSAFGELLACVGELLFHPDRPRWEQLKGFTEGMGEAWKDQGQGTGR